MVSVLGVIFAVLTNRETDNKTFQNRITWFTGTLSSLMVLFWVVGTLAYRTLGSSWR